ncbi:MAG: septum formation inhibitor Maf [Clostridia bacterium]|nr:septum formation inhibitor Maf [Clostridia bacterium]
MKKIILASGSPRRKEILSNVNVDFEIIVSDVEEVVRQNENPETVVKALAFEKAYDVSKKVSEGIIIASDTVVYKDEILGKPKNEDDAIKMLSAIRNTEHTVYTGICIIEAGTNNKIIDVVKTKVYTKNYSDDKIKRYVATGEVWGKAGAYAIQGFGATLIDHIEGDYLNVVGLPLSRLETLLEKYFDMCIL